MRSLPLAALALVACGGSDGRSDAPRTRSASLSTSSAGPDAVVLRVARTGGRVRAYVYPRLDSLVWTSSDATPPIARVLGFDESAGSLAVVDAKGVPRRVNLRLGSVIAATRTPVTSLASSDGSAIFGLAAGAVTRLTPSDARPWSLRLNAAPRDILPQSDGSVLAVADRAQQTVVWRIRAPDTAPSDSVVLPLVGRPIAESGERVYFLTDTALVGLVSRTLEPAPALPLDHPVRDAAVTPSGDRVYLVTDSVHELQVVDRYRNEVTATVELPGAASALRMDALGRYLLVRVAGDDATWVVAIGTDRLIGVVRTAWRTDLPVVAPDGMIGTTRGRDVVFVDGETLRDRTTVRGGAADFWHLLQWNGFRPRAAADQRRVASAGDTGERPTAATAADSVPVRAAPASPDPGDTAAATSADSVIAASPARAPFDANASATPSTPAAAAPGPVGFTVQFTAARSEDAARAVAAAVRVSGEPPRIVATQRSGITLFRVVLGPYPTRADAERVGRRSGRDYWVYEGEP